MKCLVIIPAYNEAENIAATVDELLAKTRSFPMELDYLVVNDGSSDNTEAVLREHGFHFITLPVNLGIGGAVPVSYTHLDVYKRQSWKGFRRSEGRSGGRLRCFSGGRLRECWGLC